MAELRERLERAADEAGWIDTLLRSGEVECGLQDAGSAEAEAMAGITDACAEAVVSADYRPRAELLSQLPTGISAELTVATPEGFAYYAMHPMQYAHVVERCGDLRHAVVIGIRSIGTTLSAVTAAALRRRGARVERFTVRPQGHPFDRHVSWETSHLASIRAGIESGATFLVVDEGPGLSGSSFLSVAEALCAAGVGSGRIVLIPGYAVDPLKLRAKDAEQRWNQFRWLPVEGGRRPSGDWIGAGEWRSRFLRDEQDWPGVWTSMERAKFLSLDQRIFWKFEGLGPYGARSDAQARALADNGFGPKVVAEESGFVGYEFVAGTAARKRDLNTERIKKIASYCAFRGGRFGSEVNERQQEDLSTMLRVNFEREFGESLSAEATILEVVKPAVCDGKMAPHEWLIAEDGRFLKLDATSHGDDHFFPGPCDVAWDLAGAILEWEMDAADRDVFLSEYQALSGDDASGRIAHYLRAYAVFRFAWARMAAAAMKGTAEEDRLMRDYRRYREYAERAAAAASVRP